MSKYFDKKQWNKEIAADDWYLRLDPEFKRIEELINSLPEEESEEIKEEVYNYFEEMLENGVIPLAKEGPNWDNERKRIDTIVIHHTSHKEPLTLPRLNTKHLLKLYVPFYQNPNQENKSIKGRPIWSGHFKDGKQVFYSYHWLVRLNGKIERLLKNKYVGWHAGNWDVNTRSIAICLDGDFESSTPEIHVLNAVAKLIKAHYNNMKLANIVGHREVNPETVCPGNLFLEGWKDTLMELLRT